jgi:hypothetical protein
MIEGVDYSYDPPTAGELIKAGKKFVVRYGGVGNAAKWLTTKEVTALRAAGIEIVANAEKSATAYKGTQAGVEHATQAMRYFTSIGMPVGRPIYFSVDWDAGPADWPAIDAALKASAQCIGIDRVGVYGGYKTIEHCVNAKNAKWFWQTYAWSGGKWHPKANIRQYKNSQKLGSGTVDYDQAMTTDYGQWGAQMARWYVDKGLQTLINQVKARNAGMTVGTIGDPKHAASASDHNPESDRSVDAADFMIAGSFNKTDAEWLFDSLTQARDIRLAYVIYNKRIVSSTVQPWKVRGYSGSDPHTNHVHVSVNDKHENNPALWRLVGEVADKQLHKDMIDLADYSYPKLSQGMHDDKYSGYHMVARVQSLLRITVDGDYGAKTAQAVAKKMGGGNGKTVGEKEWVTISGLSTRAGK